MYFTVLGLVSLIPLLLGMIIYMNEKTILSRAIVYFLIMLFIWQIDVALLYGTDLFSMETAETLFQIGRFGSIMIMPILFYFMYLMINQENEAEKKQWFRFINIKILIMLIIWSLAVFAINLTSYGVSGLKMIKDDFFPDHYYPVFGPLNWTYYLNVFFVFINIIMLIVVSKKLTNKDLRSFSIFFCTSILFVFFNGILSGYQVVPLFLSSFGSVLSTFIIFMAYFNMHSKRIQLMNRDLRDQKDFLHKVMDLNPSYIYVKNHELKFVLINKAMSALYGKEVHELIGKIDSDFNNQPDQIKKIRDEELRILAGETEKWAEPELAIDSAGNTRWIEVTKIPVRLEGETYILCIGNDVTQKKRDAEVILKTEKMSVIGELAASIAHEIRNPLTSIKGFVQFLQEDELMKQRGEHLRVMSEEIDRINEVVGELLLIAKPQMQTVLSVDLKAVIEDVLTLMKSSALQNNISLVLNHEADLFKVSGNKNHLKQVFINLVKNAIESMPDGGTVETAIERLADGSIRISISDEGIGLSQERMEKLGEPFYTTKDKGTGLGLTVCYKIIREEHAGEILFESEEGRGTTVHIILPAESI
ncbi:MULTISPECIES: ATP-binding protein [Metabacillus]|uniref:ATP-binding protein n=1 Tax=Metabacillus hrfriensis TaxID=3048891 RepID=A0ACD4RAL9_9BACI|nr:MULTISPECIES: ATP-binding protein [Metabacillus]UAL51690.1 PAS domain S-box protein [Metabacillus dongyingensis]USK27997.1 PAS domain S-box protein [Bacillus sp. CMF21]WHZ57205.1 ATP-binding protein [Metabacillus sp. CT-WN-B3]